MRCLIGYAMLHFAYIYCKNLIYDCYTADILYNNYIVRFIKYSYSQLVNKYKNINVFGFI